MAHAVPLNPKAMEWARGVASGAHPPATPKPSATVILLREGTPVPETYLLIRTATMAFAEGMAVFPGGGVDPADAKIASHWAGQEIDAWAERMRCGVDIVASAVAAAVRETFEETGVILAGPDAGSLVADTTSDDWEADRQALLAREHTLTDILERRDLVLRSDLLVPWAHWVTPEFQPKRYDTWFFAARLPEAQDARHVSTEADTAEWMGAVEALDALAAGKLKMLPPTELSLKQVAEHPTVEGVLEAAAQRPIVNTLPTWELKDDHALVTPAAADGGH